MSLTKEDLLAINGLIERNNVALEQRLDAKLDAKFKEELAPIKTDIFYMKHEIGAINKKLDFIKEDIEGLREEIIQIKNVVHIP